MNDMSNKLTYPTKPGWYWYKHERCTKWRIVEIEEVEGELCWPKYCNDRNQPLTCRGQTGFPFVFVGPLEEPRS